MIQNNSATGPFWRYCGDARDFEWGNLEGIGHNCRLCEGIITDADMICRTILSKGLPPESRRETRRGGGKPIKPLCRGKKSLWSTKCCSIYHGE